MYMPFTPARKVQNNPFSLNALRASGKTLTPQQAESLLEYDLLTLLDFDFRVEQYKTQPFSINWKDSTGRKRKYTPDVLVSFAMPPVSELHSTIAVTQWLPPTVYEVKPYEILKRDWETLRPKYRAAMHELRANGMRFKLITEKQIRTPLLENARFLLKYKDPRFCYCSEQERDWMGSLERHAEWLGVTTPKALLDAMTDNQEEQLWIVPWLWHLIAQGRISCELSEKLTMNSPVWFKRMNRTRIPLWRQRAYDWAV